MAKFSDFLLGTGGRRPPSSRKHSGSRTSGACEVDTLEERLVLSPGILANGVGAGSRPRVSVFDSTGGTLLYEFNPYPEFPTFTGGVQTAAGYILDSTNSPIFPVVITALGPGMSISDPVRVFSVFSGTIFGGRTVQPAERLATLNPFPGFGGGIFVGAADFNGDGFSDVIAGAGSGGGPHVKVFSLANLTLLSSSFVYDPAFRGGIRVTAGKVNADNIPDLITGAGPTGGPHVKVYNGLSNGLLASYFAFSPDFKGGIYVAAGDFNGNGRADIVTGAGEGGGPHVRIFADNSVSTGLQLPGFLGSFFAYNSSFRGGVRVAAAYVNTDNIADLIVAPGPGDATLNTIVYAGPSTANAILYQRLAFTNPLVATGSFPSSGKYINEALRLAADVATATESATPISIQDVRLLFDAALNRLEEAGVSQDAIAQLGTLELQVTNLGGDVLGVAHANGIAIDDDAAGLGYFVDSTPYDDQEFNAEGFAVAEEALGRVDLLTVILHELGHHLGLDDLDPATNPHQLMTGTYIPGERRLPSQHAVDTLFSGNDLFDRLLAPSLF